jgi:DNA-binding transcriptional LysR family regulator
MKVMMLIAIGYGTVELHQLRYFAAVAEGRHFTRAARQLGVAQPSVSKQIRLLEEELGATLFHRTRGNVTLTPAGEAFLPWARQILSDLDAALDDAREVAGLRRGRMNVGATPSISTAVVPQALARFHAAYPGIDLRLREAGSRELVRQLDEGELDVALVILPVTRRSLETEPLLREELVVAMALDHPLAGRKRLAITDLRDVPMVMFREGYDLRATTLAACADAGFEPRYAIEGGEMDGVLRLTEAGMGVAIVPSMVVARGGPLVSVRLRPALTRTIAFAYRRDRRVSRAARELMATVVSLIGSPVWMASMPAGVEVVAPART